MTILKKSIKQISVQSSETWIEKMAWRKANKYCLRKSEVIALRIFEIGLVPHQVINTLM